MISVNMHEAKSRLSQLVLAAIGREEVILCSKGAPRVRLVPLPATSLRRHLIQLDPSLRVTLAWLRSCGIALRRRMAGGMPMNVLLDTCALIALSNGQLPSITSDQLIPT